jgi:hypothetical protein
MTQAAQAINRVRDQSQRQVLDLHDFDYSAPAELFPSRSKKGGGRIAYRRFDSAAEALRFAVEELPETALLGAYLQVDEARFGRQEIHYLYASAAYPLKRPAAPN